MNTRGNAVTKQQLQTANAIAMFKRANPTATVGAWDFGPNAVRWADGSRGMAGG